MALTVGTGPFAPDSAGSFNFDLPQGNQILFHPIQPRVRGEFNGEVIVDSRSAKLLHETGILPVWYFPREDVRFDLLQPTEHQTFCPFKGNASYWSVVVGDRVAKNAVWAYPEPLDTAPDGLADHVAFYFDRLDRWFEEGEERLGHPRDPFHRIDVLPSSSRVRVLIDGEELAAGEDVAVLFETGLPQRYYFHPDDVNWNALEPLDGLRTRCAYKGVADEWFTARAGGREHRGIAWRYADPVPELVSVAGRIAFFNERVDIEVDGELIEREPSPFASEDWVDEALAAAPSVR